MINNLLFILSSLFITMMAKNFQSFGPHYEGGGFYILFLLIYSLVIIGLAKFSNKISGPFKKPSVIIFLFSCFILSMGEPLFENDHYRYLWEGKIFIKGMNPYRHPPESSILNDIYFSMRQHIGYPYLSSVYPPLGLLWFSLASFFNYFWGLKVMVFLNSILTYFWLKEFEKEKIPTIFILLLYPFFQKEFIQSVHIDLFAVTLFYGTIKTKKMYFLWSAFFTKVLSIISYPFYVIEKFYEEDPEKNKRVILLKMILSLFVFPGILFSLWLIFANQSPELSGPKAFSQIWLWNPGFYNILKIFLHLPEKQLRSLCLLGFALCYALLIKIFINDKKSHPNRIQVEPYLAMVFSTLLFFSPVFNPWYLAWLIPFVMTFRRYSIVLYILFSSLGYLNYGMSDYRNLFWIASHIPLGFMVFHFIKDRKILVEKPHLD